MNDYIIAEEYTLPSKGMVYDKQINPNIKIRSMTTEEEMKRLGHSDLPYKLLAEIIDDCLVVKPELSTYDLCIGDYQFLLHKLRVVTYGSDYKVELRCPICGTLNKMTIDLDKLGVQEYSDQIKEYLHITLPRSKKSVQLRLQTPRMLDDVKRKSQELLDKSPDFEGESAFLFTLTSVIHKVDGQVLDSVKLEAFVRSLPMQDANYILKSLEKIDIGVNPDISCTCKKCKHKIESVIPITGEFFGPSID